MYREAQTFFVNQLQGTAEGKLARLSGRPEWIGDDRSIWNRLRTEWRRFAAAPSQGKYAEKLLGESGLVSREQNGSACSTVPPAHHVPIANEGGKIVAFGCARLAMTSEIPELA